MSLGERTVYKAQKPRPYQMQAIEAVQGDWLSGKDAVLVAMATGTGKTTVMAELARTIINPEKQRGMFIAHTREIVEQIYERLCNQFEGELNEKLYCGLKMYPGIGIVMAEKDSAEARLIVGTRQSLHAGRLSEVLKHGAIDYLIIDEAHHAVKDNTYGALVYSLQKKNPHLKIVGFTATPKRTDRKALKTMFEHISYQFLIPDAIAAGYLVPPTRIKVETQVSLNDVETRAGDYSQTKMMGILKASNWQELMVKAFREYVLSTGRRCLAFMPSVEMSKEFTATLRADGVKIAHVDGTTPRDERIKTLREFSQGDIQAVSNMGVLSEGFDAPATDVIFLARPTRSQTLFTQILGRGLRLYPGKQDCLLVDLSVQDTRALELGSLLGRVITCQNCGADYLYGLPCCPRCNAEFVPEEREIEPDEEEMELPFMAQMGTGLLANVGSVFEDAFAAWFPGSDGYFSATMGFDEGTLIVVPPLTDENYRLVHVPQNGAEPVKFIDQNSDLASLIMAGDDYLQRHGGKRNTVDKHASWRGHSASHAQIRLLANLGVTAPENCSKGMAAQMITHALSVTRALKENWFVS